MKIAPEHKPILATNILIIGGFTGWYFVSSNVEFLIYLAAAWTILIGAVFSGWHKHLSTHVLWGFTLWAALHLAGGGVVYEGARLYDHMLLPLSQTLPILRYDQLVHTLGICVITTSVFHLTRPLLSKTATWTWITPLLMLAGMGFGAGVEMVEFITALLVEEAGVGAYVNTSIDLFSNFLGTVIAILLIRLFHKTPTSPSDL